MDVLKAVFSEIDLKYISPTFSTALLATNLNSTNIMSVIRCFDQLPPVCIASIASWFSTADVFRLLKCGSFLLNQRLMHSSGLSKISFIISGINRLIQPPRMLGQMKGLRMLKINFQRNSIFLPCNISYHDLIQFPASLEVIDFIFQDADMCFIPEAQNTLNSENQPSFFNFQATFPNLKHLSIHTNLRGRAKSQKMAIESFQTFPHSLTHLALVIPISSRDPFYNAISDLPSLTHLQSNLGWASPEITKYPRHLRELVCRCLDLSSLSHLPVNLESLEAFDAIPGKISHFFPKTLKRLFIYSKAFDNADALRYLPNSLTDLSVRCCDLPGYDWIHLPRNLRKLSLRVSYSMSVTVDHFKLLPNTLESMKVWSMTQVDNQLFTVIKESLPKLQSMVLCDNKNISLLDYPDPLPYSLTHLETRYDEWVKYKGVWTTVSSASRVSDLPLLIHAFQIGCHLTLRDSEGLYPIQQAAREGHLEIVKWMHLEVGISLNSLMSTRPDLSRLTASQFAQAHVGKWAKERMELMAATMMNDDRLKTLLTEPKKLKI